ncbi:hypothetical protein FOXG_17309 [Fusarium oxysporum f. sp. lycopersici 4287]|uniref:Uncharacterized protein n=1 Tax=Fusarium oxysporum f. sp. lycopersici (strain 4287 / CBS 123668 / FGSC 9935 / NRRL 34936) TaxID=426428 RepID=A0A0J9WCG8_FUSO4|nr:hypothetical protein FOXG_17309 [Fusarium oxysporum f. sp. lycopersici 4287]KNB20230.1 hypothetical protein FOXG_17309 [Fusarium oxysporum f. sp. lycopersici 4287]
MFLQPDRSARRFCSRQPFQRPQTLPTGRRRPIFLVTRPTSLARTFAAPASAPSPDWDILSDTSSRTPRRKHSSVRNAHDAFHAAICCCVTSRSCTRPRSRRHVPAAVATLPPVSPPARGELGRIASQDLTQLHPMRLPVL